MCWKSYSEENAEIKTAERDIRTVKVVIADRNENNEEAARPYYAAGDYSPYSGEFYRIDAHKPAKLVKTYEKGETYRPNGFDRPEWHPSTSLTEGFCSAEKGFHSYSPKCGMQLVEHHVGTGVRVLSEEWIVLDSLIPLDGKLMLMDCMIPEGARYCVNEFGEYVSDTIRVEGFRPLRKTAGETVTSVLRQQ